MGTRAPNITDVLADRVTTHAVSLLRYDADLRRRILRILKALEKDLIAQLAREDPSTIARPTFRERRLLALAEQTRAIINTAYRQAASLQYAELKQVAALEDAFARASVNTAIRADILTVGVSEATLREIARNTLIAGAPSRDWWAGQSQALQKRFVREIRTGLLAGETLGDLTRRVRGTRERGFTDGIMQASTRDAQALIRTSVQAVTNHARLEVYRANDDVVKGTQWHSTLDSRTTIQCAALDGASWDLDGSPLPGSPYQGPDPNPNAPPLHWNCRSTRVAVLKSIGELTGVVGPRKANRLDALPESTRSSMDGQVAASLTFGEWLKGKEADGPAFANQVLGKVRAELWRAGKLPLRRLIDQSGNPLTLEQLKASVRGVTATAIEEARAA